MAGPGKTARYINRELSWLEFNRRILHEARDPGTPLLERVKFLAITATNLDEFFMVRVGGLQQLQARGRTAADIAGMSVARQLQEIGARVRELAASQDAAWIDELRPALAAEGIRWIPVADLTAGQLEYARRFFENEIAPVLTPVAATPDAAGRWPGLGMNFCVRLRPADSGKNETGRFVVLRWPRSLARTIELPDADGHALLMAEDIVRTFIDRMFPGESAVECVVFRVTRNADMSVREDLAGDLLERMRDVIDARRESACVRLEIEAARGSARAFLQNWLGTEERDTYDLRGLVNLGDLFGLTGLTGYDHLREPVWSLPVSPEAPEGESMFRIMAARDLVIMHPPDSFEPVTRLIDQAADDPDVLAIKQILYRTSRDSPIIAALARAAEKGKQVCVIVELKARFDEERNIESSLALERAGVQVIYGIGNLKTHAKVCVIMRREPDGIRRYVHFGTGNYNEITARAYSDVSLMTSQEDFGADASAFFNMITGHTQPGLFRKIAAAPHSLRERLLELIDGETQRSRRGGAGRIVAKLNSLADRKIIDALYKASRAGVDVRLVVRGVCCLRPGVPGLSERIVVTGIIDRYLEHSRILYFHHGGDPLLFISSADWMPRNLDRRIELLTPVEDPACARRLKTALDIYCADNSKAWELGADGGYRRIHPPPGAPCLRAQERLQALAWEAGERRRLARQGEFVPQKPGKTRR